MELLPVCNYEGSDYQETFWDQGGRSYEDAVEGVALKRLLPGQGRLMLELGAGAGRNTPRYAGYERVVLVDYAHSQLEQARARLGDAPRYLYVAADVYRLPFMPGLFDGATMIRTLHHLCEPEVGLQQVRQALGPGGVFILEFANKRNLKAILRYLLRRQNWNPFDRKTFSPGQSLYYNFHPRSVHSWLRANGFIIDRQLSVSHLRAGALKRNVPLKLLVGIDSLLQLSGDLFQFTPSVFVRSHVPLGDVEPPAGDAFYRCPACGHGPLADTPPAITCPACQRTYAVRGGIYDFRVKE